MACSNPAVSAKAFDAAAVRRHFPSLAKRTPEGHPYAFFDGPAGTQVPQSVIDAIGKYLAEGLANRGQPSHTSHRTDQLVEDLRQALADLVNAARSDEIVLGPNMTSLSLHVSRSIARVLQPGDEIVLSRLEHDANQSPWLLIAQERGVRVRWVPFDTVTTQLDMAKLAEVVSDKTRLVCVGYACNAVGTITDVKEVVKIVRAKAKRAWVWVDAVHYAPHGPIDVQEIGCDFLVCSVYKFFGPHVGVLWGKHALLESLEAYKVRPASAATPGKWETGTANFECFAGALAAVEHLAEVGREYGGRFAPQAAHLQGRRKELRQAMLATVDYERRLCARLITELLGIPGVTLYGVRSAADVALRCPTLAFNKAGCTPRQAAGFLGARGLFVTYGHYYAITVMEDLGLPEGAVRVGLAHYSSDEDVDRLVQAVREMPAFAKL